MIAPRLGRLALTAAAACGIACDAPGPRSEDPTPTPGGPWLAEVAVERGLSFQHRSGHQGRHLYPEVMSGGAALFDMDGDGDLDAYLVQGGSVLKPGAAGNRLFENRGGRFADVSEGSGADDRGYGMGVAAGDYDDDGDVDLYVTNLGPNALLRNEGGGRFREVAAGAGVDDDGLGAGAAFLDYDADGDLDLFLVNNVRWSLEREQDCYNPMGSLDYCLPTNYRTPDRDVLYRNEGEGRFVDVSDAAGIGAASGNGLGVVAADYDGDGRIDIFVANDTMLDQLWVSQGDGRFVDEALWRGCAADEHGMAKAGMGVDAADYDSDGDPDLLVGNLEQQTDSLFRNASGLFSDWTGRAGLGLASRRFTRFGLGFADFDNDGWLDLYQANGRVARGPEPLVAGPLAEPNLLFRGGPDGRFTEVEPRGGTAAPLLAASRAAVFGDVDDDGGVDVLVVNRDAPAHLLLNVKRDRGHWIRFQVLEKSGRDALGAVVTLSVDGVRLARQVKSAYSYLASNDPRVHIGLAAETGAADVSVRWADGEKESFGSFQADRTVVLHRGQGKLRP